MPNPSALPHSLNVLLIGGGGREHALARKLVQSPRLGTLWITHPDNPGLRELGKPVDVPVSIREIYRLEQFCTRERIHVAIIGPEDPLAEGFADKLRGVGVLVFGPGAEGARLEADKAWAKQLMRGASIPTAEGRSFTDPEGARRFFESRIQADDDTLAALWSKADQYRDPAERRAFINQQIERESAIRKAYQLARPDLPVIKAAGLAKGKGVIVPGTLLEGLRAIEDIGVRKVFGEAGRQIVVEERLAGVEVSVLAITDGRTILVLPPCQDHKRLGDNDTGPNTGGMGAFCPSPLIDDGLMSRIEGEILVPSVDALRREGIDYRGVLYAGIMLTPAGPKVLEFNCRFGDPECQPLMARLTSDLLELVVATCEGRLDECEVTWNAASACCVVLASSGYPEKPRLNIPIHNIDKAEALPGVAVDHAGTRLNERGEVVTAGGRVLGVTGLGPTLEAARAKAYAACDLIEFEGKVMRRDIGAPSRVTR
ncbi:MAG: phosphoribosylamine--glycine ligase [Phycisphaerales bacterium]|nr:MAG: phosphoribosylamine--glycine ligase [Phycisphaerales bacterium]